MPSNQSTNMFGNNFIVWKIFGIWGGRIPSKYYKYYSILYLAVTFYCFNVLLTVNLVYTPPKIELVIQEVIFYFTEITVVVKVLTVLLMRDKIIEAFDIIDCDEFVGDYKTKDGVLYKIFKQYKIGWKAYTVTANIQFVCHIMPMFLSRLQGIETELPICKYYFLSDEDRQSYYFYWFIYQALSIYGHMMYNVSIDAFNAGLLMITIAQLRILNINLSNFQLSEEESKLPKEVQDTISIARLNTHLKHYDTILKYHGIVQDILSATVFGQFSSSAMIICVLLCQLILFQPELMEEKVFLTAFLFTMAMQIFVPGFLGTQISHESQDLINAAYHSDWIPRSEPFKKSLRIFMNRALIPIEITGLQMFSLSLATFMSIMKSAYSFFTLVRTIQEE